MTARLTMICCGATAATRKGSFPLDEPLENSPTSQPLELSRWRLRHIERVWTSPTLRARQTAQALSLDALENSALRDQDFGIWAGKSLADIEKAHPHAIAQWRSTNSAAPHGGESLVDLSQRVAALMDGLLGERGHTVAITHAVVMRVAMLHVLEAPLQAFWSIDIEPFSLIAFSSNGNRWTFRTANQFTSKHANRDENQPAAAANAPGSSSARISSS